MARSSRGVGFCQFLLRGLEKVNQEWSLICTGHNLMKLFRYGARLLDKGPSGNSTGNPGLAEYPNPASLAPAS